MKKWKNHSWAKKRFRITKKGKVLFKKSCNNHLMTNKGKTQKKYPYKKRLAKADVQRVKDLLPY